MNLKKIASLLLCLFLAIGCFFWGKYRGYKSFSKAASIPIYSITERGAVQGARGGSELPAWLVNGYVSLIADRKLNDAVGRNVEAVNIHRISVKVEGDRGSAVVWLRLNQDNDERIHKWTWSGHGQPVWESVY